MGDEKLLLNTKIARRVHIVGNGPICGKVPDEGLQVRFNRNTGADISDPQVLWINNARRNSAHTGFISEGASASKSLDFALLEHANLISRELRCWPSTGMVAASYFSRQTEPVEVHQMPLLPSFSRSLEMSSRQPLACSFHNWLGERRMVFTRKYNMGPWQSLFIKPPEYLGLSEKHLFEYLSALPDVLRSHGAVILKKLSQVSPQCWLNQATYEKLSEVEHLFVLKRGVQETKNWWLYDVDASHQTDTILRCLAWCQQQLFLNQVVEAP